MCMCTSFPHVGVVKRSVDSNVTHLLFGDLPCARLDRIWTRVHPVLTICTRLGPVFDRCWTVAHFMFCGPLVNFLLDRCWTV